MQVRQADNTNFRGFEFRNAYARQVFDATLKRTYEPTAKGIKKYIKQTSNEPNKIIIDATKSRTLFATFSNNADTIEVYNTLKHNFNNESILSFIKKSAKKTGYPYIEGQIVEPPKKTLLGNFDFLDTCEL